MKKNEALELIKRHLEKTGTRFSDYYGSFMYSSGSLDERFFTRYNEGTYTVQLLEIPKEVLVVDENKLIQLLKEEKWNS